MAGTALPRPNSFSELRCRFFGFAAIVCLGAKFTPNGLPSTHLLSRLKETIRLAKALPNAIVVVTGGFVGVADYCRTAGVVTTEARMMATFLVRAGIDPVRIFLEERAVETIGNFILCTNGLVREKVPAPWLAVSQDWHLLRGLTVAQHLCFGQGRFYPYPAPCPLSIDDRDARITTDLIGAGSVAFSERLLSEVKLGDLAGGLTWTHLNHVSNPYRGLTLDSVRLVRFSDVN